MTTILYGIKTCDTVRKARKFLDNQNVEYRFHDFRQDGLPPGHIDRWLKQVDWNLLLNQRGTTWRQLPETAKADLDADKVKALMLENPTLIKRPVLEIGTRVEVGFDAARYRELVQA